MSEPTRDRAPDEGCELQPVTCWPLIYAAAGVVALGVLTGVGFFVADAVRPLVSVTEVPAPKARPAEEPAAVIDRGPDALPPKQGEQGRVVKVERIVVREYVPLPPVAKPKEEEWMKATVRLTPKAGKPRKPGATDRAEPERQPLQRDEKVLAANLARAARELDLETEKEAGKKLLEAGRKHLREVKKARDRAEPVSLSSPLEKLLEARADLRGLPLLAGKACQTDRPRAKVLGEVSLEVRELQGLSERRIRRQSSQASSLSEPIEYLDRGLADYLETSVRNARDESLLVGPLEQMYQVETAGMRAELVKALAKIKGKEATQALARRAVFDLSPRVRKSAVEQLQKREGADAREVFLEAMRHPWEPAADHAAWALAELEDDGATPDLRELVDMAAPSAPVKGKDGRWTSRELVRVNHLRNCLLCHAPSTDSEDLARAPVPTPGEPLPVIYYGQNSSRLPLVRADVVYFRQDFSAMHQVEKPNRWPAVQRFDYLVRARELSEKEAREATNRMKERKTYPQREAVRWAIARLEEVGRLEPRR